MTWSPVAPLTAVSGREFAVGRVAVKHGHVLVGLAGFRDDHADHDVGVLDLRHGAAGVVELRLASRPAGSVVENSSPRALKAAK